MVFTHGFSDLSLGDSISVSGACLTLVAFDAETFTVQVSPETLLLTTLGEAKPGKMVNLERALPAGARLGGHMVSGHVDAKGRVISRSGSGEMVQLVLEVPRDLTRFLAKKGSVTVEGVSLTINEAKDATVSLLIIPHTASVTTLGTLQEGDQVNLEVDLVARYVERLLSEAGILPA